MSCESDQICQLGEDSHELDFCSDEEIKLDESKALRDLNISPTDFCAQMGYKVFEAPACYNGKPLATTLSL